MAQIADADDYVDAGKSTDVTEITVNAAELNLIKKGLATVIANADTDDEVAELTPTIVLLKDIVSIQLDLGW